MRIVAECIGAIGTSRRFLNVRFSNRPFGVKHFQAIHRFIVDVAHGLALLFGLARPFHHGIRG